MLNFRAALLATSLLAILPATSPAQEAGLAERRAIAAYAKDIWPPLEKSIQDAASFAVPVTLDQKSLALPGLADSYASDDYLRKTIIDPLTQSLAEIASSDIGKQALQEKLKSIFIHFDEASAPVSNYADGVSFEDGVLTLNWKPLTNVDDVEPRTKALTTVLEQKL
jgi:hypothetical protein